jgi:ribosomal-protein-alanine N-acetyltransferase
LSLRITRFTARHLRRILEIEARVFPEDAYPREMFLELYQDCGSLFFLAHAGGNVAGYAVTCASKRKAELVSIAVDLPWRGSGIGSVLLQHTIQELTKAGIRRLDLTVRVGNRGAIAFYRRHGFETEGRIRRYYENGGDAFHMFLRLPPEDAVEAQRARTRGR